MAAKPKRKLPPLRFKYMGHEVVFAPDAIKSVEFKRHEPLRLPRALASTSTGKQAGRFRYTVTVNGLQCYFSYSEATARRQYNKALRYIT